MLFPVTGGVSEIAWDQVTEGQQALLLRNGRPAVAIMDLKSWRLSPLLELGHGYRQDVWTLSAANPDVHRSVSWSWPW